VGRRIKVGDDGIVVPASLSGSIDVLLDEQRVWSFNPDRDARPFPGPGRRVRWPQALADRLQGTARVRLVDHASRAELHTETVAFRGGTDPLRLTDAEGHPLSLDKGGRLQRDFAHTGAGARDEIMDALEKVLHDLQEVCGLDAYLMYGCLLGAVRDGHMIGHDSDADVAYLSAHTHPFDIIRECTTAIRRMRALGWHVVKMSGANFKVWVPLPDGRRCGIDVFGSFHIGDSFYVTGSLRGTLDPSALKPFGTVTLEGREIVAPARPEEVLQYTYGPDWRVPDPAFHFDHDPADVRRMDSWFRSQRHRLRHWHDFYKSPEAARVPKEPSLFAHWVGERLQRDHGGTGHVLDLGAGTGRDSAWFAEQGYRVTAYDFTLVGLKQTAKLRKARGVEVPSRFFNLEDLRTVLVLGARLAHRDGVRHVYARGLLDTLSPNGRANLYRFASMVQRRGGETYLEFRSPRSRSERTEFRGHRRAYVDPDVVVAEVQSRGGTVVHREEGRDLAPFGKENPFMCRLVVRWSR